MTKFTVLSRETLSVPAADAGTRLDRFLTARADGRSRAQVQSLIEQGWVRVNGRVVKPSYRLRAGDTVEVTWVRFEEEAGLTPEPGPLRVLYEDESLLVVAKPAGVPVHPGAGHTTGTLVHRLIARYPEVAAVGHPRRPGIVHRLDRVTSGLLVVARTPAAYLRLVEAFQRRRVHKHYVAIVWGRPHPPAGVIETRIGRHPRHRKRFDVVSTGGKWARTRYRLAATTETFSRLHVWPYTGRTHQIRVHLTHVGHPIVGDPTYGHRGWHTVRDPVLRDLLRRMARRPAIALHAGCLALPHPVTGTVLRFRLPPPRWFRDLWARMQAVAGS
ncbi:Ribosomal large subunit pseudouridine synthase D [bacterium HR11]|nr:Ribosomal large subunit pseudouridine synthase D [bacterium HR11]